MSCACSRWAHARALAATAAVVAAAALATATTAAALSTVATAAASPRPPTTSPDARPTSRRQVLASPRVRLLHDFITGEEAAEIMRKAEPLFTRSPVRSVVRRRRALSLSLAPRGYAPALQATDAPVRRCRPPTGAPPPPRR